MAIEFDPSGMENEIASNERGLRSSDTAYGRGAPSSSDLARDARLRSLKQSVALSRAQANTKAWYGEQDAAKTVEKPAPSLMESITHTLSAPTYAAAGALKSLVGKSDKGFVDTVNDSMRVTHETFGDVLGQMGAPGVVAGPLGFALDVGIGGALDPLSLIGGAGRYSSAVHRAGAGLKKAGAEGLSAALKSSVLEKASGAAALTPFLRKSNVAQKLYKATEKATTAFEKTMGEEAVDYLVKPSNVSWYGPGLGEAVEQGFKKVVPKGDEIWDTVIGLGNAGWYKQAKLRESLEQRGFLDDVGRIDEKKIMSLKNSATPITFTQSEQVPEVYEGMLRAAGAPEDVIASSRQLPEAATAVKGPTLKPIADVINNVDDIENPILRGPVADIRRHLQETAEIAESGTDLTRATNPLEHVQRMLAEAGEDYSMADIFKFMDENTRNTTNLKQYDDMMKKVRSIKIANIPVLEKTLNAYETFIGLFKTSKVSMLSPSAMVNSVVGNPVMWGMMGGDVLDPAYFGSVKKALNVLQGKAPMEILQSITTDPVIGKFVQDYPKLFQRLFGFDFKSLDASKVMNSLRQSPEGMAIMKNIKGADKEKVLRELEGLLQIQSKGENQALEAVIKQAFDSGKYVPDKEKSALSDFVIGFYEKNGKLPSADGMALLKRLKGSDREQVLKKFETLIKTDKEGRKEALEAVVKQAFENGQYAPIRDEGGMSNFVIRFYEKNGKLPTAADLPANFSANFVDYGAYADFKKMISDKAAEGSTAAKMLNWYMTKPVDMYELSDASYRLGTFFHLTQDGVSASVLDKVKRFVNIDREDIVESAFVNGQRRFKLTGDKAAEISSETYMNYAAMPAAIRVLRSVPILGSPFASFGYGMLNKTAKTLVMNPSFFPKANFFLQETSNTLAGPRSPMEREAVDQNYPYLNDPFMLRLGESPLFRDNPVYMNVRPFIPYLSNLLNASDRRWSDTVKGKAGQILDSTPFLKDPVGALMMNYLILPNFVEEGEAPQNMFGGALYPEGATTAQKAGYALRDLGEALTPGALGAVPLAADVLGQDWVNNPDIIEKIPSYRWRAMANAMQGLNAQGAGSKTSMDHRGERTIRAGAANLGVSLTPIDLTSLSSQIQKNQ